MTGSPGETRAADRDIQDAPFPVVDSESAGPRWGRIGGALLLLFGLGLVWTAARELPLSEIVERGDLLRARCREFPLLYGAAAFLVLVVSATLSLPIAAIVGMCYGWLFGAAAGILIVSFGSTMGSTLAFLASRFLLRRQRESDDWGRLSGWRERLERNAAWSLFTLRLQPAIPFSLVNVLMGTTRMRIWTFWWVSQLGMLPLTTLYAYAGSNLPRLQQVVEEEGPAEVISPQLLIAISLAGFCPWLIHQFLRNRCRR